MHTHAHTNTQMQRCIYQSKPISRYYEQDNNERQSFHTHKQTNECSHTAITVELPYIGYKKNICHTSICVVLLYCTWTFHIELNSFDCYWPIAVLLRLFMKSRFVWPLSVCPEVCATIRYVHSPIQHDSCSSQPAVWWWCTYDEMVQQFFADKNCCECGEFFFVVVLECTQSGWIYYCD